MTPVENLLISKTWLKKVFFLLTDSSSIHCQPSMLC